MSQIVDLIVLNHNGLQYLKGCLQSLYKNTEHPFHLIVVDNASSDGSRGWLYKFTAEKDNIALHFNEDPDTSFSKGNNDGLRYAEDKYVLLLNNDILIIRKGWLKKLVSELDADEKIGVVGVKLLYPNDLIQHAGCSFGFREIDRKMVPFHLGRYCPRDTPEYNVKRFVPMVTFACVLIRRELLKDGLDEAYKLGGFEDTDFCCKVRKQGYKILYTPEVELYHYEGATCLARPKHQWMMQLAQNWQTFTSQWNDWLKEDFTKNSKLYEVRGPVKDQKR